MLQCAFIDMSSVKSLNPQNKQLKLPMAADQQRKNVDDVDEVKNVDDVAMFTCRTYRV